MSRASAPKPLRSYTNATSTHSSALTSSDGRTGIRIVRISCRSDPRWWNT